MLQSVLVLVAIAVMFAVVYALGRVLIRVQRSEEVHCPVKNEDFIVQSSWTTNTMWEPKDRVDIVRCTAFSNPSQVSCEKHCLRMPVASFSDRPQAAA